MTACAATADPHRPDELVLADGRRLRVRPIGPEDRERLAGLFARLSDESRYRRFLGPKRTLTAGELTRLTDIDHVTHEALAAIDPHDCSIVGVARYARWEGHDGVADISVAVADDLHGRGIGGALVGRIVQRARANGVRRLTASTLWENAPARALLKRLAFGVRQSGHVLDLELDLAEAGAG